ncbi:MAG: tetratricopeptide repeat protein [Candidatus Wallbacteria bacterium]
MRKYILVMAVLAVFCIFENRTCYAAGGDSGNADSKLPSANVSAPADLQMQIINLQKSQKYNEAALLFNKLTDYTSAVLLYDVLPDIMDKSVYLNMNKACLYYAAVTDEVLSSNISPLIKVISKLEEKKMYNEAAGILKKAVKIAPQNPYIKEFAVKIYPHSGNADEVLAGLKKELDAAAGDNEKKELTKKIIDVYIASQNYQQALELVKAEMAKYPDDSAYKQYIYLMSKKGNDFNSLIELMAQKVNSNSGDSESVNILYSQAVSCDTFEAAIKCFENLYKTQPENFDAAKKLCKLYIFSKKYEAAENLADGLLARNKNEIEVEFLKGRILFDRGNYEAAKNYLTEYLKKYGDKADSKTNYYIALSELKLGRNINALSSLDKSLSKDNESARMLVKEAEEMFYSQKTMNVARNFFNEVSKKNPYDHQAKAKEALFEIYNGDTKKAFDALQKAYMQAPDSLTVNYLLGLVYAEMGQAQQAVVCFKNCVKNDPESISKISQDEAAISGIVMWPFGHYYNVYIHSAIRIGDFKKLGGALRELMKSVSNSMPANFVVSDPQKMDVLSTRPEYSFQRSYKFFIHNIMDDGMLNKLNNAPEPKMLMDYFLKDSRVRDLYEKSQKAQKANKHNEGLDYIMKALEVEPENPLLIFRGSSLGLVNKPFNLMLMEFKIIAYAEKIKNTVPKNDEELFMHATAKLTMIGMIRALAAMPEVALVLSNKNLNEAAINNYIKGLDADAAQLKKGKLKNFALMLEMSANYFKGDMTASSKLITEYLKNDEEVLGFMWNVFNIGEYYLRNPR